MVRIVFRHGIRTDIGVLFRGSAVLFNIRKIGPKIFTEGGLKTLLEARHPIKVRFTSSSCTVM
jgi:hypothetical protein